MVQALCYVTIGVSHSLQLNLHLVLLLNVILQVILAAEVIGAEGTVVPPGPDMYGHHVSTTVSFMLEGGTTEATCQPAVRHWDHWQILLQQTKGSVLHPSQGDS